MKIPFKHIRPARVISEDKDFVILEVGKHDGVKFTLDDDKTQNRFLTTLFVKSDGVGGMKTWDPFDDEE